MVDPTATLLGSPVCAPRRGRRPGARRRRSVAPAGPGRPPARPAAAAPRPPSPPPLHLHGAGSSSANSSEVGCARHRLHAQRCGFADTSSQHVPNSRPDMNHRCRALEPGYPVRHQLIPASAQTHDRARLRVGVQASRPLRSFEPLTCSGLREACLLRCLAVARSRRGASSLLARSVRRGRLEPLDLGGERGPLLRRCRRGCCRLGRDLLLFGQRCLQLLLRRMPPQQVEG